MNVVETVVPANIDADGCMDGRTDYRTDGPINRTLFKTTCGVER